MRRQVLSELLSSQVSPLCRFLYPYLQETELFSPCAIDTPSVRPYLPPAARSGTSYSFDPLPPTDPLTTFYDDSYFAPLHGAAGARRRRRNPNLPGGGPAAGNADMVAAMRDGLMRLLGMGADGPQVELNDEVRAELLEELAMLNAGGGGMPGGLGGEEDDDDEDWEDDGDEEGDAAGREEAARGLLQRMAGIFGLGGSADDTDALEAEEGEREPAEGAQ